jgi:hypothetical protein
LDRLDKTQPSEPSQLLRRALDIRGALNVGLDVGLDAISADEFYALFVIQEETERREREK